MDRYERLATEITERSAGAFVHVGDRFDDDMSFLTRFHGPDRPYAFVLLPTPEGHRTVLCAPSLFGEQARREFPGTAVRTEGVGEPPAERAAAVLAAAGVERVLVPASIPHAAVARLADAGIEATATAVLEEARRSKPSERIERHRVVQEAATAGMAAAESALATATVRDGGRLASDGEPMTTESLRRVVNGVLAEAGVEPAGNTVIGAGPTAADLHYTGTDPIHAGETVLLDLSPRGPEGAYADLTRTFVVDSDGGWERRAYVACEAAREAALEEVAAGVPANRVNEEATAELAAHGFRVDSREEGFTHSVGHGVGFSLHEAPTMSDDDQLRAGDVVTIEPGVYDPAVGGVRLEDTVVVRENGFEMLASYPFGLDPEQREITADD